MLGSDAGPARGEPIASCFNISSAEDLALESNLKPSRLHVSCLQGNSGLISGDARASMGLAAAAVVDLTADDEIDMLPSALVGDDSQQQHTKPSRRHRAPPAAWQLQENKREQPRLPAKRKAPRTHAAADVKPSQLAAVPPSACGCRAAATPQLSHLCFSVGCWRLRSLGSSAGCNSASACPQLLHVHF